MPERKGASYKIKATRPASHHGEHTQTTQATAWANSVGEQPRSWGRASEALGYRPPKSYDPGEYPQTDEEVQERYGDERPRWWG